MRGEGEEKVGHHQHLSRELLGTIDVYLLPPHIESLLLKVKQQGRFLSLVAQLS